MAMDPAIVFMFSICFLENFKMGWRRNLLQIIASAMAVTGTVLFAIEGQKSSGLDFSGKSLNSLLYKKSSQISRFVVKKYRFEGLKTSLSKSIFRL